MRACAYVCVFFSSIFHFYHNIDDTKISATVSSHTGHHYQTITTWMSNNKLILKRQQKWNSSWQFQSSLSKPPQHSQWRLLLVHLLDSTVPLTSHNISISCTAFFRFDNISEVRAHLHKDKFLWKRFNLASKQISIFTETPQTLRVIFFWSAFQGEFKFESSSQPNFV